MLSCSRCGRPICGSCSIDASVGQRCPECVREEGVQKVIPTGPRRRPTTGAPVTLTILAVTAIFFVLSGFGSLESEITRTLAQSNPAVAAGEWWRIFTPILLHGSFMHILFNMWALWVLGPQIERAVGGSAFLGLYIASAGMGGVAYYLSGSLAPAVGASGAIFGLFGVWLAWALRRRNTAAGRAMLSQIGFLLLINAALPFLVRGIAWQAHLGGLIIGFVIGLIWGVIQGPNAARMRTLVAFAFAALAPVLVIL